MGYTKIDALTELNKYIQVLNTDKEMQTKFIKLVCKSYEFQKCQNKEPIFTEEEYNKFVTSKANKIVAIEEQIKAFELIKNYIKS